MLIQCDSTAFKSVVKHIPFWRVVLQRLCYNIEKTDTTAGTQSMASFHWEHSCCFFIAHRLHGLKDFNLRWKQYQYTTVIWFDLPLSLWWFAWGVSCTTYTGIGSSHAHRIHSQIFVTTSHYGNCRLWAQGHQPSVTSQLNNSTITNCVCVCVCVMSYDYSHLICFFMGLAASSQCWKHKEMWKTAWEDWGWQWEGGREREQDKEFVISLSAEEKKILLFWLMSSSCFTLTHSISHFWSKSCSL